MIVELDENSGMIVDHTLYRFTPAKIKLIKRHITSAFFVVSPNKKALTGDYIYEELPLARAEQLQKYRNEVESLKRELKERGLTYISILLGNIAGETGNIKGCGLLVIRDSTKISNSDFRQIAQELNDKYDVILPVNYEALSQNIAGVECHWGFAGNLRAHIMNEISLANYYN